MYAKYIEFTWNKVIVGTELLVVFVFVPMLIVCIDATKIVKNENRTKHLLLLGLTFCGFSFLALTSYIKGYSPLQVIVIGSIFFLPAYLILYFGLTICFAKITTE